MRSEKKVPNIMRSAGRRAVVLISEHVSLLLSKIKNSESGFQNPRKRE